MTTLYLTHSIYHLLFSLSMINTKRDTKSLLVLATADPAKTASLLEKLLLNSDGSLDKVEVITISTKVDKNLQLQTDSINEISKLKKNKIDEFIFFNEDDMLAIHLGQFFHSKNTLVSLAQDGMKAYVTIDKPAWRYRLLASVDYYKYCKANNFSYSPILMSLKYGKSSYSDKLYVSHLKEFRNHFKKEIEQIDLDGDILKLYASLGEKIVLDRNKKTVFFVSSQLKYSQASIDIETKILKHINSFNEDCQLVIKLHPRASKEVVSLYKKNFENWLLINDKLPAEIYINELANCSLYSAYSGVALFNKDDGSILNKYWLYPLYGNSLKSLGYTTLQKPDNLIHLVQTWDAFYSISC